MKRFDEPIDEPISEPIDEPIGDPIDGPIDDPIDDPVDDSIDDPMVNNRFDFMWPCASCGTAQNRATTQRAGHNAHRLLQR